MNKQDRHGARTPEDVVRRFKDIPNSVEAAQKAASDANKAAENANNAAANATQAADKANADIQRIQKLLSASETLLSAIQSDLSNKVGNSDYNQIVSMISRATNAITRLVVHSGALLIDAQGNMIVPRIVLNGMDLDARLLAIEEKLNGGSGQITTNTFDGGTKYVGDEWTLISTQYVDTLSITAVTGGLEIINRSDGIGLRATREGSASATVKSADGKTTNIWNYSITQKVEECHHPNTPFVVTKYATCTEDGEITYECATCGETWSRAIAALGHDLEMEADDSVSLGAVMACQRSDCDYREECNWDCDILGHNWRYYDDPNASSGTSRECKYCDEREEDVSQ